jgi:hypothetical protein
MAWLQEGESLVRDYELKDFAEAMAFVNRTDDDRAMAERIDGLPLRQSP